MSARNFFYDAMIYDIMLSVNKNCIKVSGDDLIF